MWAHASQHTLNTHLLVEMGQVLCKLRRLGCQQPQQPVKLHSVTDAMVMILACVRTLVRSGRLASKRYCSGTMPSAVRASYICPFCPCSRNDSSTRRAGYTCHVV